VRPTATLDLPCRRRSSCIASVEKVVCVAILDSLRTPQACYPFHVALDWGGGGPRHPDLVAGDGEEGGTSRRLWERRGLHYRTDIPGPTTQVGTRTDYSVGPWDYLTWAA
jgi:hypothetical protein